jgi:glycosyltransferase involved in cell wall biosynthesis
MCKIVYGLANKLVVHSKRMKGDLIDIFRIPSKKISVIPHGMCLDYEDRIPREEAKTKLGIKEKRVILFFGLVRKYKGLEHLLAAFRKIKNDFDVALLIAGDFVEGRDRFEKVIREYGIKDKMYIYPGYVKDEDVPLFFSSADFLVQPYVNFTGQSGIPPTAYFYSRPVIATDVGGLAEIVISNKTGLIVEPKNIDEIANAIRFFLENPEKIEEYGANGKRYLETHLSWDSIAAKMLENYLEAMDISRIE